MKLIYKLLIVFFIIIFLIGILAVLSIHFSRQALQESLTESSKMLANQVLAHIDMSIQNRLEEIQTYSTDVLLLNTLEKSNAEFDRLDNIQAFIDKIDKAWTSMPEDKIHPFMNKLMRNNLSIELRERQEYYEIKYGYSLFPEIFVTNKYGVNVAQAGRTSDYRQDDEKWWQEAKEKRIHISDFEYDKSAAVYAVSLVLRIDDDEGNFSGVIKCVLNIKETINIIKDMEISGFQKHLKSLRFKLANKTGRLIYSTDEFNLFDDISEELVPVFGTKGHSSHIDYRIDNLWIENKRLLIHVHSEGYKDYKGLGWILILSLDTDEIFGPIIILKNRMLASLLIISALALFISLIFSRSITKPIDKLIKSTNAVSAGILDTHIDVKSNDEIGTLASSFNLMIDSLITANVAIKESEEKFRSIGISAQDAIIMINNNGDVTFWNQAAENTFGYSADEAVGRNLHSLIMPEKYSDAFIRGFKQFQDTGNGAAMGKSCELDALRKNGDTFPIELSLSSVKIQGKRNAIGIVRDITERKQSEQALKQRQLEASILYNVSSAISRTIEIDKLFDIILKKLTGLEILKVMKKAGILLVEDNRMELVAHLGHQNAFLELHRNMTTDDCLCGLAARTGEIIVSSNSEYDCNHTIKYPGMTPHGHIIVPLMVRARVIGVLYLYTLPDAVIDEVKINILSALGSLIGIAIDNARLYEETKNDSLHDSLTGLANRRMMQMTFDRIFAQARRTNKPFSLILMDLDHFKNYNDIFGHTKGDKLLIDFAKLVIRKMRQTDVVLRYGGEEFLILLSDTDMNTAYKVAERIRKTVEHDLETTISLGVASYENGIEKAEDLINIADKALYKAKEKGRNRIEKGESTLYQLT